MSEEEKDELQEQENTEELDSQADETPVEKVDWEKRYKDLQSEYTKTKQDQTTRIEALERQYDQPPEQEAEEDTEMFVDKKTVSQLIDKAVKSERMERADSYFRKNYPDMVKFEGVIAGLLRNPVDPKEVQGMTNEDKIDHAVKEFNQMVADKVKAAEEAKEVELKAKEEQNRKASGLGGPSTTPAKSDDEGELSDADEIKQRKARQAKRRNIA